MILWLISILVTMAVLDRLVFRRGTAWAGWEVRRGWVLSIHWSRYAWTFGVELAGGSRYRWRDVRFVSVQLGPLGISLDASL